MPAGATFTALAVGDQHSCGLRGDGSALCWGNNGYGQATVPAGATFTALVAGDYHTCGLRDDGSALCWGYSAYETFANGEPRYGFGAIAAGGDPQLSAPSAMARLLAGASMVPARRPRPLVRSHRLPPAMRTAGH